MRRVPISLSLACVLSACSSQLHPSSAAHAVQRKRAGTDDAPREVPGAAWRGKTPFLEHAIGLGPEIGVMSWIVALA